MINLSKRKDTGIKPDRKMRELEYPFDSLYILKNKIKIIKELKENNTIRTPIRIAVLGGSTTHDICTCLQIFLLNHGLDPDFYESEYNRYWEEAVFSNERLKEFKPDIIYIHITVKNISAKLDVNDTDQIINQKLTDQYQYFETMWNKLREEYQCPIIQNNFERPLIRLYGNQDISNPHGFSNFVFRLNSMFYEYSRLRPWLYINDIDYVSSAYGLDKWYDDAAWYMYKYAMAVNAIPEICYSLSNIIKSLYGKNKKVLTIDLDNTLWSGVISEDGLSGIEMGNDSNIGEAYFEIQKYVKEQKQLGVILAINSKNDLEDVKAAFQHPDMQLSMDDFSVIEANWENKDGNIKAIAEKLNLGLDSIVFMDDNPVERDIVKQQLPMVTVPSIDEPEKFIRILNRGGYFEITNLSDEDKNRAQMYYEISQRNLEEKKFVNYNDFLVSLNMQASIQNIDENSLPRVVQLINKSNQFNLTAKRYTEDDIRRLVNDKNNICLYGRLKDKFGDNGIVSVLIARKKGKRAEIDLFLLSCRVFKRGMEAAMLDVLFDLCIEDKCEVVTGIYYKTKKNSMVKGLYENMGFKLKECSEEEKIFEIKVKDYIQRNTNIRLV